MSLAVSRPTTEIHCTGDRIGTDETGATYLSSWPFNSCVMFGSGESNNLMRSPILPIVAPVRGDTQITFPSPNSARTFAVGDLVIVEAKSTFFVGATATKQTWLQMDLITAVDVSRNKVTLQDAYSGSAAFTGGMELRKLTNTGLTAFDWAGHDTHVPLWATHNSSLIGGRWMTTHVNAAFTAGGGSLDCIQKPAAIVAAFGLGYSNLLAHCQLAVPNETISSVPIEMAWGSHDNTLAVGTMLVGAGGTAPSASNWFIALDEGAHDNTLSIDQLSLNVAAPGDVILLDRASRNTVMVGSISGSSIAGNVINIRASAYQGSPPDTALNHITAKNVGLGQQKHYVSISGAGTTNNRVDNSTFSGNLTQVNGTAFLIYDAGQGNSISRTAGSAGVDAKRWLN